MPPGTACPMATTPDTSNLIMRVRITDYYYGRSCKLWDDFESWSRAVGFEIYRDHSAQQIGVSCGIVAAHISTTIRTSMSDFMIVDTRLAVSTAVLRDANVLLAAANVVPAHWGYPDAQTTRSETMFLNDDECTLVANMFYGGPSDLFFSAAPQIGIDGRFLTWQSFDYFFLNIAQKTAYAAAGTWFGKKYVGVNTHDSRSGGMHWVSAVFEIIPRDPSHPYYSTIPAREAVPAAITPRTVPPPPLAPIQPPTTPSAIVGSNHLSN